MMNKLEELLFLKNIPGYGNASIRKMYLKEIEKLSGVDECARLLHETDGKVSLQEIEISKSKTHELLEMINRDHTIRAITVFDEAFPEQLNLLKNQAPLVLYARGDIDLLRKPSLAVIGTRKPSDWSIRVGEQMVKKTIEISHRVVVSGLALGCDAVGHKAAVENGGKTIAVLPSGINVITPASNKGLADKILDTGGCIISEYQPMEKVQRVTYAKRDGIIAALADATFVIECGINSGTMITVKDAYRMGKKIGCYMASEDKGAYEGNAYMIKEYSAVPVTDTPQLISFLDSLNPKPKQEEFKQLSLFDS